MYFVSAFWTPSSHFPTAAVGGMQPASSPPKGSPSVVMADDPKAKIADASSRPGVDRMIVFPPVWHPKPSPKDLSTRKISHRARRLPMVPLKHRRIGGRVYPGILQAPVARRERTSAGSM